MSGTLIIVLGVISGILILFALGAIWYNRRGPKPSASKYQVPAVPARSPEDELSALGILEIRPRTSSDKKEAAPDNEEADEVEIIEVESDQDEPDAQAEIAEEVAEPEAVNEEEPAEEDQFEEDKLEEVEPLPVADKEEQTVTRRAGVSRREALFRLLNAVQASVDGYTACLIRREAGGRCHIEAIVSQNPQALESKSLTLDDILDLESLDGSAVQVLDLDAAKPVEDLLGYYREPVAVRQVAFAPIKAPGGDERYFLLVDALSWQDLDDPWQRLMVGQFATLLGTFMSTPLTESEADEYIKPRVRPRREIVAEEIERARSGRHPLALALIYLNRAEEIAGAGGKAISDAERTMADRLELAADGGRLERFGELTYGIFQDESVSEVEAWALQLQEELVQEGDCFDGGVSIGIALLQDRHKDADDFRADATEALREAFETGACTIIE